jgi:hypothetical protein
MVHRVVATAGIFTTAFVVAACGGGSTITPAGSSPSVAGQKTSSESTEQPGKLLGPAPADREVHELTGFVSPTGNVSCMIDADFARCDIIDRDWSPPPRPADCEFDYGQGISLAPGEQAEFVCAGDTAFGADEVLPYGQSITAGVLRCESAQSGITCRDVPSGHGFSISLQAYRLF